MNILPNKPRPLEKEIQKEICQWLESHNFFFWRCNNIPVFGLSNDKKKRFRALPKYTPKGLPDIIVIVCGVFYALEVKRPHLPLRKEQEEFKKRVIDNGGFYHVVTSVADVRQVFF